MAIERLKSVRLWRRGLICFAGALAVYGAMGVVVVMLMHARTMSEVQTMSTVMYILMVPAALLIPLLAYRGVANLKSRHIILSLDELDSGAPAPVLFLRPFAEDGAAGISGARTFNPIQPSTWWKLGRPRELWLSTSSLMAYRVTFEDVLRYATREIGPLVAIGRPNSPPLLGAYNLYVGADWKERVEELATRAQLVVLVAGSSPGLLWEAHSMRKFLEPRKFLIFIPDGLSQKWNLFWRKGNRNQLYARFRELTANDFPVPLPEKLGRAAFIGFGPGWRPFTLNPPTRPPASLTGEYVAYLVTAIT